MAAEINSLYLIAGTDTAKIDVTRARLRGRAEKEGGVAALEVFEPVEGRGPPDHKALLAAIPALSLTESRRYLLADGVQRWRDRQLDEVSAALADLPPDLSVVLIARGKAPAKLVSAVKAAKGELHEFYSPKTWDLPRFLTAEAKRLGFRLQPTAARVLVDRIGSNPMRLSHELERLALWTGRGGEVTPADLDEMVADSSEAVAWTLSDALLERDLRTALITAERLTAQGENMSALIYGVASQLRKARSAVVKLEAGVPPKEVEPTMGMHPYAARKMVDRLRNRSVGEISVTLEALADLEIWCRGWAEYGDELALVLALRRAIGEPRAAAAA